MVAGLKRLGLPLFWVFVSLGTLAFTLHFAFTSPYADEWGWTEIVCGEVPVTWHWLFRLENQHCLPLVKLVYLGLGWLSGFDLRAGSVFSVSLLALLALALMQAAARARGRASIADVLFPLVLLQWGHYVNLIFGIQLFYVLPVVLAGFVLLLIFTTSGELSLGRGLLVTVILTAMALCGGAGIFYVPWGALWLAYAGFRRFRRGETGDRATGVLLLLGGTIAVLPLACYLANWQTATHLPGRVHPGVSYVVTGLLRFLALAVGKAGREAWPVVGAAVVVLSLVAIWRLLAGAYRQRAAGLPAAGLAFFLAGCLSLAAGLSWARCYPEPRDCSDVRYVTLVAPLAVTLLLLGSRYVTRLPWRWELAAAVAACGLTIWYDLRGWNEAAELSRKVTRMEELVADGFPIPAVATRCSYESQEPEPTLVRRLELLRRARLGPYRNGVQLAAPRKVVVLPTTGVSDLIRPAGMPALTPDATVSCRFPPPPSMPLRRIEVEIREGASPCQLSWSIEDPSVEPASIWAQGTVELGRPLDRSCARIDVDPKILPPGRPYQLILRSPAGSPGARPPRVPLYIPIGAPSSNPVPRAYLFFEEQSPGAD